MKIYVIIRDYSDYDRSERDTQWVGTDFDKLAPLLKEFKEDDKKSNFFVETWENGECLGVLKVKFEKKTTYSVNIQNVIVDYDDLDIEEYDNED